MKETVKKSKAAPVKASHVPQSTVGASLPNSVYLGIMGDGYDKGVDHFEEKMMARMQQFRDNQRAGAEQEADRLAADIDPNASLSEVKSRMGERLGADFSEVRIHTDAAARDRADSIGAEAYTSGKDVYFGSDGINAQTVAHELVHTVQQGQIEGTGVSESAPAESIQMKPGKFARLKQWFKKKLGKQKPPSEEPTVAAPSKKAYRPDLSGMNIFHNMNQTDKVDALEYYRDSDPNQVADVVDAGEFDDVFDQMEDAQKVDELQKLSVYLSAKRKLAGEQGLDEHDRRLQQTYYSSLQKASGNRDFLKELMKQTGAAGQDVSSIHQRTFDENLADTKAYEKTLPGVIYENDMKGMTEEEKAAATKQNNDRRDLLKKRSDQHKLNQYKNTILSDEGMRFNALRFMLNDAANLMTDGNERNWFNEKRRLHFSQKQDVSGKIVPDDSGRGHEGQTNQIQGEKIVHTDTAQFVSDMHDATSAFRHANQAGGSFGTESTALMNEALERKVRGYKLFGQR